MPAPPWHYSGDVLTIEYRTDPDRVAAAPPGRSRARRGGPGSRGDHLGRLAVVQRLRRGAARPRPVPVQGVLRRRPLPIPGRDVLALRVHLGRQGLRARAGLVPGLSEEDRVDLDDASRVRRSCRASARRRRRLRGVAPGERPAPRRGPPHAHRRVRDGRVRERPADAALPMDALDREGRRGLARGARHDGLPRRGSRTGRTPATRTSRCSPRRGRSSRRSSPAR